MSNGYKVRQPERRKNWQMTCEVLCKPVSDAMNEFTKSIRLELLAIKQCIEKKAPMRLFIAAVVLAFSGSGILNWGTFNKMSKIETNVAVIINKLDNMEDHEKRLRLLELRESRRHPGYWEDEK